MPEKEKSKVNIQDLSQDISSILQKKYTQPVKQIYLDWIYIQDYFIGTLLMHCNTEETYAYIRNQIPSYNSRIIRDRLYYFPKFPLNNDQVMTYIRTPQNIPKLLAISPMTNMFQNIRLLQKGITIRNNAITTYNDRVTYIVNMYPLPMNNEYIHLVKGIMDYISPDIKLGVVSSPISQIDIKTLVDCDILFIDDLDNFLSEDSETINSFYNTPIPAFVDSAIISPRINDNLEFLEKFHTYTQEQIDSTMKLTQSVLNLCTSFAYMTPLILLDEENQQENIGQ